MRVFLANRLHLSGVSSKKDLTFVGKLVNRMREYMTPSMGHFTKETWPIPLVPFLKGLLT